MAPSRFSSSSVMSSSTAPAVLMVIGSCTSLQFGASLATQLFGPLGATGVTTLRLGLAAVMLALVTRRGCAPGRVRSGRLSPRSASLSQG